MAQRMGAGKKKKEQSIMIKKDKKNKPNVGTILYLEVTV